MESDTESNLEPGAATEAEPGTEPNVDPTAEPGAATDLAPITDPLSQLRDIHLPADPALWPPAPGWWILLVLGVALLVLLVRGAILLWRRGRPKRRFLATLSRIDLAATGDDDRLERLRAMSRLARRYAIFRFGRESVAALYGPAWLEFMHRAGRGRVKFSPQVAEALTDGQFTGHFEADLEHIRRELRAWGRAA